jgi:hypothetical protein
VPDGFKSNRGLDAIATRRVICCEIDGQLMPPSWLVYMNGIYWRDCPAKVSGIYQPKFGFTGISHSFSSHSGM